MGNEIKRDSCPAKYCDKGSLIKDSLSTLAAALIVAYFSGNLFHASGLNIAVTILIEAAVVLVLYGMTFFLFKGVKKRLAETYISVCEGGICGICPQNGFKNKEFSLTYDQISKLTVRGDRLILHSQQGVVNLTLTDAAGTAALIRSKNSNL